MRVDEVEVYSDETNRAVLRHPGRKFPGVLVQGDSLHQMCQLADKACTAGKDELSTEAYDDINKLRNALWGYLTHYKVVLGEHGISLPFNETP